MRMRIIWKRGDRVRRRTYKPDVAGTITTIQHFPDGSRLACVRWDDTALETRINVKALVKADTR